MKKIFITFMLIVAIVSFSFAKKVSVEMAHKAVSTHIMQTNSYVKNLNVSLVHTYEISANSTFNPEIIETKPLLYIFNIGNNNGIIIVSGDDVASPILGYTTSGSFDITTLPYNFKKWIEGYNNQISYAIENELEVELSVKKTWKSLLAGEDLNNYDNSKTVAPLCSTTWNQSPNYNALCPDGSVTGCVATAMAQVMKFWNHPAQGSGMHSYNHSTYGTLSANFGSTSYQWSSMPNSISGPNNAIATLMYHCGVSVDMNYSPNVSGAWVVEEDSPVCSESAFKNYFGYNSSLHGEKRDNFTTSQWTNMLKTDLDAGRPLVYAGFGSGGGHAFVCDGYNDGDYFHFNWGWGSAYDGFFHIDALESMSYYDDLAFSTTGVSVEPGTYLIALQHKPDGGSWNLSGSTSYPNPIQVIVRAAGETADIFEPNDNENNARDLTVNFSGNSASIYTTGANSHNGNDYDFYDIYLPTGYDYTITCRAHDSYNSGNGQSYTNDVLWSYNSGLFWSSAVDDVMFGDIMVNNGGAVKFLVAPYFLGETGTYLLDLQISRTPLGIDDNESSSIVKVYPVPVSDNLNLEVVKNAEINRIQVMDVNGKTVLNLDSPNSQTNNISVPVNDLSSGTYVVIVNTDDDVWRTKFIKK